MIERGAGTSISEYSQLESVLDKYFADAEKCMADGKIASDYVNETRGGTKLIMNELNKVL